MFTKRTLCALVLSAVTASIWSVVALGHEGTKIVPLISKDLGFENKEGMVLTVEYAPGAETPIHRHDAHVFVYVLKGAIVMKTDSGDMTTVRSGEMFYESPEDIHTVSKNASSSEPAKFLVFFVKDKDTPPVIPVQ